MNTSQLLVVSSVGLAVNLVGMLATGGHHHHGHSHGGHDHSVSYINLTFSVYFYISKSSVVFNLKN